MNRLPKIALVILGIFFLTISGCGDESKNIKANSVQVVNSNGIMIFGDIAFHIGPILNPQAFSDGEALGPVKVLIVREIAEKDLAAAKKYGLKAGCVYLQKGPAKYKYIQKIDLSVSDEALARQFLFAGDVSSKIADINTYFTRTMPWQEQVSGAANNATPAIKKKPLENSAQYKVYPSRAGIIKNIFVVEGEKVIALETKLYEMDDSNIKLEIETSQAKIAHAKAIINSSLAAGEKENLLEAERSNNDAIEEDINKASAVIELEQLKLDMMPKTDVVYSPVTGRVTKIFVFAGQLTKVDQVLLQISEE